MYGWYNTHIDRYTHQLVRAYLLTIDCWRASPFGGRLIPHDSVWLPWSPLCRSPLMSSTRCCRTIARSNEISAGLPPNGGGPKNGRVLRLEKWKTSLKIEAWVTLSPRRASVRLACVGRLLAWAWCPHLGCSCQGNLCGSMIPTDPVCNGAAKAANLFQHWHSSHGSFGVSPDWARQRTCQLVNTISSDSASWSGRRSGNKLNRPTQKPPPMPVPPRVDSHSMANPTCHIETSHGPGISVASCLTSGDIPSNKWT